MNTIHIEVTYSNIDYAKGLMKDLKDCPHLCSYYDDHYIATITNKRRDVNTVIIDCNADDESVDDIGGIRPGDEINIIRYLAAFSFSGEIYGKIVDTDNWLTQIKNSDHTIDTYNFTYEDETNNYSVTHTCLHFQKKHAIKRKPK